MAPVRLAHPRRRGSDAFSPPDTPELVAKSPAPASPEVEALADDLRLQLALSNDGLPTRDQFNAVVEEYYENLTPRKREKALLDNDMMRDILLVLKNPSVKTIRTAQFRFWVRKMFTLAWADGQSRVLHEDRIAATREGIYDIIYAAHKGTFHAGRDKTMAAVRKYYSYVPKEIVAAFVKVCPTCNVKRTAEPAVRELIGDDLIPRAPAPPPKPEAPSRLPPKTAIEADPFAFGIDGCLIARNDTPPLIYVPSLEQATGIDVPWLGHVLSRPTSAASISSDSSGYSSGWSSSASSSASSSYSSPSSFAFPDCMPPPLRLDNLLSPPPPLQRSMSEPAYDFSAPHDLSVGLALTRPVSAPVGATEAGGYFDDPYKQPFFTMRLPGDPQLPSMAGPDAEHSRDDPFGMRSPTCPTSTPTPDFFAPPAGFCASPDTMSYTQLLDAGYGDVPSPLTMEDMIDDTLFTPTMPSEPFGDTNKTRDAPVSPLA